MLFKRDYDHDYETTSSTPAYTDLFTREEQPYMYRSNTSVSM